MIDAPQPPPFPTGTPPPPESPPVPSSQRFPTWKQAFVMLLGGLALAVSACFGCMFAALSNGGRATASLEGLAIFLAILSFGGMCAALVGVVFVLMRIVRVLFAKKDESGSVSGTNSGSAS